VNPDTSDMDPQARQDLDAKFPGGIQIERAVAHRDQARTSKIILNGVSVARRKRLKPASVAT
jgi:hypothetical protein